MRATTRRPASTVAMLEPLEGRQLFSVAYDTNLIGNPGAEADTMGQPPGSWTSSGAPVVQEYTVGVLRFPVPPNHGNHFFGGGKATRNTALSRAIDLSAAGADVDAGKVSFDLAGYLGSTSNFGDYATLTADFLDGSGARIGGATADSGHRDRGFFRGTAAGVVPAHARSVMVKVHFMEVGGTGNLAAADNLSLVLHRAAPATGTVTGSVYNDLNGNGARDAGDTGLSGVTVFADRDDDGVLDSGERRAVTGADGSYRIDGVAPGSTVLRTLPRSTFRASTPARQTFSIRPGQTTTDKSFGMSQTPVLGGTVFNDADGNRTRGAGEAGLAGVTVYLDFNNNGQLDAFELKTRTDANGNYRFVVPFGTYVVRQVVPAGFKTTTGPAITTQLGKGAISTSSSFGDRRA